MTELPVFYNGIAIIIRPCFTHNFFFHHNFGSKILSHHHFGKTFVTYKTMSSSESNKRNWFIQLNNLNDDEIDTVMQNLGDENGDANIDINIHYATVALYLGWKKIKDHLMNLPT
jgi:hypothetical protein